jgi:hypothetical protein
VRDTFGKVYQLAFGEDGIDPIHTVKVKGNQEVCDVSRIADRLNMEYELSLEKPKTIVKKIVKKKVSNNDIDDIMDGMKKMKV